MLIRNSLLSLVRTKGKTFLFTLLIVALTLTLSLGVCVWASIQQFLDEADEFYTTIGLVEYIGRDYPQDTFIDQEMAEDLSNLDIPGIESDPATLLWDGSARYYGYVDGFWRDDDFMSSQNNALIVVSSVTYNDTFNAYTAFVTRVLNSYQLEVDDEVLLDPDFGYLKEGHYYVIYGETYKARHPFLHLRPLEFSNEAALDTGIELPTVLDITVETANGISYDLPEVYEKAGVTLKVANDFVVVNSTDNLLAMYSFHQEEQYIVEGRAFSEEEYSSGERVIVIPDLMAARLDKTIGDVIDLSFIPSDSSGSAPYYWAGNGVTNQASFKIIGIINTVSSKEWHVYIPKAVGAPYSVAPIGYIVGQAVVKNAEAAEFAARVDPLMQGRFLLTMYDQGYANVAVPFTTILNIARILTVIIAFVELAVLIFFGYLFVYRQRESGETLLMLGAGKPWVGGYFLLSAGVIALSATLVGAVVGFKLHDRILQLVAEAAKSQSLIDNRYSNGNFSITRVLEFAPQFDITFFLKFGLVVFAVALLSCLVFLTIAFRVNQMKRRRNTGPQKEGKTSRLRGGSRKYAILSILRGGTRTTVVPLLAVAVVFFLGQLATTSANYHEQLDGIYENTTISGKFTDIHGKQIGDQVIDAYNVMNLYRTGMIEDLSVSRDQWVLMNGTPLHADGTEGVANQIIMPENEYKFENMERMFGKSVLGIQMIAINDFNSAPEFYYLDNVAVNFLEGYDESILTVPTGSEEIYYCITSSDLMENYDIVLGDTIRVSPFTTDSRKPSYGDPLDFYDLLVVGSYEQQSSVETIYVPLPLMFDTSLIWDVGQRTDEEVIPISEEVQISEYTETQIFDENSVPTEAQKESLLDTVFYSSTFNVRDSRQLSELKDYLIDYGYSQVNNIGKYRTFIVIDDAIFNNAVAGLKQQIRYTNTLYPFLYVLVGVIAFVVSYLLVVNRRMELAILRGLGATSLTTFLSFFMEQSFLCLLGVGIGVTGWILLRGSLIPQHLWLALGFVGCYFIGSGLSIAIMNKRNLLMILSDKD